MNYIKVLKYILLEKDIKIKEFDLKIEEIKKEYDLMLIETKEKEELREIVKKFETLSSIKEIESYFFLKKIII